MVKYVVLEKTKMLRFISFAHLMHLHLLNWFNTPLIAVAGGMWALLTVCYILFVCVEVLRPSQHFGVMQSMVSLPNHMFTGQA